ncbi:MAG: type I DNA topoisomerase [Deltaproteobacteria bacterium]|nr:type I DNA topoisomerase [Deltaproteobacteria bacterium]
MTEKAKAKRASGHKLVVVESPAKAKTIKKYLGREFEVKASVGHIKDLPKSSLGVDVDKNFKPTYELIKGKKKVVDEITKAAKKASSVYLAPDPDREGEAIAWHVAEEIGISKERIHRVLFNEITKQSVLKAIENPEPLNREKYESQQARRILDRLVGYQISPILWRKVRRGLSAGRVQSVAVRMIVEREREVTAFVPKAYWTVVASLTTDDVQEEFQARLVRIGDKKIDRTDLDDEHVAAEAVSESEKAQWNVISVQQKQRRRNPDPPFITSTMQQEGSRKLFFSAKKTMRVAQQLYEGIELGDEGAQGLITYMRTDSVRISPESITQARAVIEKTFGKAYVPNQPIEYKNKKNAQDAHEAIRPTSLEYSPERVKSFLDEEQFKLYEMIWKRFLACQMEQAVFDQTVVDMDAKVATGNVYGYRATGSVPRFAGFLALWQIDNEKDDTQTEQLPDIRESSRLACKKVASEKHMTQPPPRFSESSLIKELEEKGIGRPSTYATILSTIQDRKYAEKKENRFYPTDLGVLVTELLVENFSNIVDEQFTATMEDQLDQIEEGKADWIKTLRNFYAPFKETLKLANTQMRNVKQEETPTNLQCPKCEKSLVIKWGKNGKFAACQGYPECRFTSEFVQEGDTVKLVEHPTTDEKCTNCGAPMIVRMGRFGRFLACSEYPKCKTTKTITTGIQCPECKQGELSEKRTRFGKLFYSCSRYPSCKYALWNKPVKTACPMCSHPFIVEYRSKKEGGSLRCPNKECTYQEKIPDVLPSTGT